MNPVWIDLLVGLILAVVIAGAAWRIRTLNAGGALAAAALGTVVFGLGGLGWAILLMGFFLSSSLLSRLFRRRKAKFDEKFSKGAQRDAAQVAANGAIAGVFTLLHLVSPQAVWPWVGFAGAFAAANADTWATELGVLSRRAPRAITSGKQVEPGTSGGISLLGMAAAGAGALWIALLAVFFWQGHVLTLPTAAPAWAVRMVGSAVQPLSLAAALTWLVIITLAGVAGSLVDSLLGATVQAMYFCPTCQKETERYPRHTCGTSTRFTRGWPWLNNDWVNITCTLSGSILCVLLWML